MSIVIVTIIAVVVAFFIAKSIHTAKKSTETTTPFPPEEPTVSIEHQIPPYIPTPRVEEEPVVIDEPVVIENKISTPVVLGSDNVSTKPKPKKKPTAKMSAAPKKAKTKKTDA